MFWLSTFVDVANKHGISNSLVNKEYLFALIKKCHPFVLKSMPLNGDNLTERKDIPFSTCSFEDSLALWDMTPNKIDKEVLLCLLINEITPKELEFFTLVGRGSCINKTNFRPKVNEIRIDHFKSRFVGINHLMDSILSYLHSEITFGIERGKKLKISHKDNNVFRSESIIHIRPRNYQFSLAENSQSHIEWSNAIWVMGHWRNLGDNKRIGKNRDGEYVIKGETWITDHVRPKEAHALIRPRLFHPDKNQSPIKLESIA